MSEQDVVRIKEQIVTLFKADERMDKCIEKLSNDIQEIKERLANRLPNWATALIAVLTAAVGWFAGR